MKFTNIVLAASAATVACAYPRGRDVIPTKQTTDIKKRADGFTWVGVSESGAEFGPGSTPGTLDKDYTWPKTSQIKILRDAGMNIFRVPFLMERLVPSSMTGSPDATYLAALKSTVKFITDSGAYAVLDPHNYGRYGGNIITSTSDFKAFWKTVAKEFVSNEKVVFDTNNEYHDLDQTLVLDLNQAAIDAIRAAGATSQYIFVEGNSWSGAHSWTANNDNMKALTDSEDKIVYEMHQYLDGDSSGTSETCVSATIGKERLESATAWLQKNHKKGFIGEFAGGVNSVCESAVENMLSYMSDNSDVWMGAEWWAAGPWWGSYMYSLEPADGPAYATYLPILEKYFVDGTASPPTSSSTSSTKTAAKTTTTTAQTSTKTTAQTTTTTAIPNVQVPSATSSSTTTAPAETTTAAVVAPISTTTLVKVPTTTTAAPTTLVTATTNAQVPTGTPSTGNVAKHYYQCGGINWTGPTVCETGTTCREWNPYYFQCISAN
ncbi:Glycoside hydrolase superfamily [Penicillium robsamsonii]|uniref:Glycoside hydrolase superfamily n=1 Tax=Penicillium robsamsonii TaxID=1792511 RepID=UPI002548BB4A|nr:Glycoside hydrolase superfamily [Penicillium robsamsonii]KAJ5811194.1 Glycoside hydrolase superfamily [Penicillium robsamsonii]